MNNNVQDAWLDTWELIRIDFGQEIRENLNFRKHFIDWSDDPCIEVKLFDHKFKVNMPLTYKINNSVDRKIRSNPCVVLSMIRMNEKTDEQIKTYQDQYQVLYDLLQRKVTFEEGDYYDRHTYHSELATEQVELEIMATENTVGFSCKEGTLRRSITDQKRLYVQMHVAFDSSSMWNYVSRAPESAQKKKN